MAWWRVREAGERAEPGWWVVWSGGEKGSIVEGLKNRKKCPKSAYSKSFNRNLTRPKEEILCSVLGTAISRYELVKFRVEQ